MTTRTRSRDSFSQTVEFSKAEPTIVVALSSPHSQITAMGSSSSCFFYSALNRIYLFDIRARAPVMPIQLNSSLGAASSLVYGSRILLA